MFSEAMLSEAQPILEAEARYAGVGAIPWMDLLKILMTILGGCTMADRSAEAIKAAAANPTLETRWAARQAARDVLGWGASFREVTGAVRASLAAVAKAPVTTVERFAMAA